MAEGHESYAPGELCRHGCGLPVHGYGFETRHTWLEPGRCNIVLMRGREVLAVILSERTEAVAHMLNAMGG